MDANGDRLIEWSEPQRAAFGQAIQRTRHRIHELDLFDDQ